MNESHFDALVRALSDGSATRRTLSRGLAGALMAGGLIAFGWQDGDAKKRCPPCRRRKKGKCRKSLPDGAGCPGGTCQSGSCIAASTLPDTPPADPPPASTPPPDSTECIAGDCPNPGPCKVRACEDNVCAPLDAPNGASCGEDGETCLGGICCPRGHLNCFGVCISIACQGSLLGACDAACQIPGAACCDRLVCRQTASGQRRCRP
jgi:hypothetical protein